MVWGLSAFGNFGARIDIESSSCNIVLYRGHYPQHSFIFGLGVELELSLSTTLGLLCSCVTYGCDIKCDDLSSSSLGCEIHEVAILRWVYKCKWDVWNMHQSTFSYSLDFQPRQGKTTPVGSIVVSSEMADGLVED